MALFSRVITYTNGVTLTGPQLNTEFDNIISKMTSAYIEDYSADTTEMGTMADPYPAGTASLATTMQGEITRLRYVLAEQGQVDKWYKDKYKVRTVDNTDSPVTVSIDDWMILCDDSSGAITLNLPAQASLPSGTTKSFCFVCLDGTNNVTIDGNSSETIGGLTSILLTDANQTVSLFCEDGGDDWRVVGGGWNPSSTYITAAAGACVLNVQPQADNTDGGSDAYIDFTTFLDADSTANRKGRIYCSRGAADGDSELRFYTSNAGSLDAYLTFDEDGYFYPSTTDTHTLGISGKEFATVWADTVKSGADLKVVSTTTSAAVRTETALTSAAKGLVVQHRTTGDMGAGFGSYLVLSIRDDAGVDNNAAALIAYRSGADNTSILTIGSYLAGTLTNYWTFGSDGDFIPSGTHNLGGSGSELDQIWADSLRTAGTLKLYSGATYWTLETDGDLIPTSTYDIGASGTRTGTIYATDVDISSSFTATDLIGDSVTADYVSATGDMSMDPVGDLYVEPSGDVIIQPGNGNISIITTAETWTFQSTGELIPTTTSDIGSSSYPVYQIYTTKIGYGATYGYDLNNTNGNLVPFVDDVQDLGTGTHRMDNIYATNATIQTSDVTLKEAIEPLDLGLDFINKIEPIKFKWKGKTRTHFGISAQQLETVIKEKGIDTVDFAPLIITEEGRYGLRGGELQPILFNAIKELTERLIKLEQTIN